MQYRQSRRVIGRTWSNQKNEIVDFATIKMYRGLGVIGYSLQEVS